MVSLRLPYVDRIWRVQSSVETDEPLQPAEAFERLEPLFWAPGTDVSADGNSLTYSKSNPAAQDRLATFTAGTLSLEAHQGRTVLSYDVTSTALLLCFLAPLLFLGLGQIAVGLNMLDPPIEERSESGDGRGDDKEKEKDDEVRELHWIDQMLGAPAPETKEEKEKREAEEKKENGEGEEDEEKDGKHDPYPAYVLAGIFAAIYAVGRILEPYLLKRTFRRALNDPEHFRRLLAREDEAGEIAGPATAQDP